MATSLMEANSLLAIDIGEITTRAVLFDVVEGRYRFLAIGEAPTTAGTPHLDVSEGLEQALKQLEEISGRTLLDTKEGLIVPTRLDGSGVGTLAATMSVGEPLRVVAAGLLEDTSIASARNLAETIYARLEGTMSLNDRRKREAQIDTILQIRPDIIIVAGGIDGGASHAVMKLIETVGLACYLSPAGQRPRILYAGNQMLADEVQASIGRIAPLHVAANIRPGLEVEQLGSAQSKLAEIYCSIRAQQIPGLRQLEGWAGKNIVPTATAFGRVVRFLSKVYDSAKGVLGIDVGASATTVAAAFAGELVQAVYPQLGLGEGLGASLDQIDLQGITRWLPVEVSDEHVRDYVLNKALYPASLPVTEEELAIEQAVTRYVMRSAIILTSKRFPRRSSQPGFGLMPWFEPILANGSVISRAPSPGQSMLMLLDALQPCGVTTIVLDKYNLAVPLGAAAGINPILVIQVLESNSFINLGSVISPVSHVRPGVPVLRVRMKQASGQEINLDVKQGALEVLPLSLGQSAQLQLQPLHRADIGMGGPGRGGKVRITGGALGVVIDARGRPLPLPGDAGRRRDLFKKWLWTLGG